MIQHLFIEKLPTILLWNPPGNELLVIAASFVLSTYFCIYINPITKGWKLVTLNRRESWLKNLHKMHTFHAERDFKPSHQFNKYLSRNQNVILYYMNNCWPKIIYLQLLASSVKILSTFFPKSGNFVQNK